MDKAQFLSIFQQSIDDINQNLSNCKQIQLNAGTWRNSVVLKMQQPSWLNQSAAALPFKESVFFCIWVNDESVSPAKLHYNIHALKMRQLTHYTIKSRDFAQAFRVQFKPYEQQWPNVSTAFGPLTLMQGWVQIDTENLPRQIAALAYQFLNITHIIDDLLAEREK